MSVVLVPMCSTCSENQSVGQVCWHCHQITKGFPLHDVHGKGCYKEFRCFPPKSRELCEYCFIENHAEHQIYKQDLEKEQRGALVDFERTLGNDDHFRILAPGYMEKFNTAMRVERRTQARKRQHDEIVSLRDKEATLRVNVDEVGAQLFITKTDFNTYVLAINKDSVKRSLIGKYDFIEGCQSLRERIAESATFE